MTTPDPSTETLRVAAITADQLATRRSAVEDQLAELLTQENAARELAYEAHYAKARAHLAGGRIPAAVQQLNLAAQYMTEGKDAA